MYRGYANPHRHPVPVLVMKIYLGLPELPVPNRLGHGTGVAAKLFSFFIHVVQDIVHTGPAENLIAAVTGNTLRPTVPELDLPIRVYKVNPVVHFIE
jgi:hypothetical protein